MYGKQYREETHGPFYPGLVNYTRNGHTFVYVIDRQIKTVCHGDSIALLSLSKPNTLETASRYNCPRRDLLET